MASKTTFEPARTIEPIYTGGSVALSEDGRMLATGLEEDVLITDLETGRRLAKIAGDGDNVTTLSMTPSASHLVTCSRSLSMRIYTLDHSVPGHVSSELSRTLKPHTSPVVTSAIDNTGTLLATGAADGIVKIWDIHGGYTTHSLHGHGGVISALLFFKISAVASAQSNKGSSSNHHKKKRRSEPNDDSEDEAQGGISSFRLASGDEDGKIRIWHLKKRKCIAVLDSHVSVVRGLDFDEQLQMLLSASRDKTVMLWDASTWKMGKTIPILEEVESAGFVTRHRDIFYTGGKNGRLRLWWTSGHEATEEQEPASDGQSIVQILYPIQKPLLLSVHANQNLLLHSLASFEPRPSTTCPPLSIQRRISGTHDEVIDVAYVGGEGKFLAVATNLEDLKILSIKDSDNGTESDDFFGADVGVLQGHEDIIICIDVDWSGHWLATGAKDNSARLWRIDPENASYSCHAIFTGHAESLGAIALPKQRPPVGSRAHEMPLNHPPPSLLTGSQDKTIKRWDTNSVEVANAKKQPRALYTRKAHDKDINALDINHDGSLFVSASQDRTVKVWSFEDGESIGVLRGHKRGVWSAKFAPYGTPLINVSGGQQASSARGYVLTGSGDKTVKIWSVSDFSCLRTFEGHTNSVLKVVWMNSVAQNSPSGQNAVENGDTIHAGEQGGHKKTAKKDTEVASAGSDGLVKVWDVNSSECACTLDNHTDRVWALALNPNPPPPSTTLYPGAEGHTLVSGSADSTLTLWMNTTVQTSHVASLAKNQRIEEDQALQNYIRSRSYRPAILLALKLNHPQRLLSLFTEVRKTWPKEEGSLTGVMEVDAVLAGLSDDELLALLGRCREWNANTKTAPVAQSILWTLLKSHPATRFTKLTASARETGYSASKSGHIGNTKETLDAIRVYTERHYKRMEELVDESFLIEYTLREMDEVTGTSAVLYPNKPVPKVNGVGASTEKGQEWDEEVTMAD